MAIMNANATAGASAITYSKKFSTPFYWAKAIFSEQLRTVYITPFSLSTDPSYEAYIYMFDYFELNGTLSYKGKYSVSN